eukprot:m.107166 g.107166  ORF g.107166 m.107166 type:complete len:324 (+) comp27773_c0_seq1:190-1161(+)
MSYEPPSAESRQLAMKYISKVLLKLQNGGGKHEPPSTNDDTIGTNQEPQQSKTNTLSFVYPDNNYKHSHSKRPLHASRPKTAPSSIRSERRKYTNDSRVRDSGTKSAATHGYSGLSSFSTTKNDIHAPLHSGPTCDSVSHYLEHKLEEDQGVGYRTRNIQNMDSSHELKIKEMSQRLETENARLETLRNTREQLDRREQDAAKQVRARSETSCISAHDKVVFINKPRSRNRSIRSEEVTNALIQERQQLQTQRASAKLSNRSSASRGGIGNMSAQTLHHGHGVGSGSRGTSGGRRLDRASISEKLNEERRLLAQAKSRVRNQY